MQEYRRGLRTDLLLAIRGAQQKGCLRLTTADTRAHLLVYAVKMTTAMATNGITSSSSSAFSYATTASSIAPPLAASASSSSSRFPPRDLMNDRCTLHETSHFLHKLSEKHSPTHPLPPCYLQSRLGRPSQVAPTLPHSRRGERARVAARESLGRGDHPRGPRPQGLRPPRPQVTNQPTNQP